MEIMVHGNAKRYYSPDEIKIKLDFYTREETYSEALENGIKNVEDFIKSVLEVLNFSKSDLKTNSFAIIEEKKYDYETKKEIKLGFAYNQSATIKFDYSLERVALFMEKLKEISNSPKCNILFGIKNEEQVKNEMLEEAYTKAKEKAEVISRAANKKLKDCVKTDFRPFEGSLLSKTDLDTNSFFTEETSYKLAKASVAEIITNAFTPEDIEIEENIYCLWIAE